MAQLGVALNLSGGWKPLAGLVQCLLTAYREDFVAALTLHP